MIKALKVFFELWPFFDNPLEFPFYSILEKNNQGILLKNTLVSSFDYFIWLSDEPVDISMLRKFSSTSKIVLEYYGTSYEVDAPNFEQQWGEIKPLSCAVVYERKAARNSVCIPKDYLIRTADANDIKCLTECVDSTMRHNYIQQISDLFHDSNFTVYVLLYKKQPISFMVLNDCKSNRLGCLYKHISNVFTIPAYRNKGMASLLIQYVLGLFYKYDFFYVADSHSNISSNRLACATGFSKIGYNHQLELNLV